ncbi:MAG: ice-binding family protein [Acidimicrobiales bacterium]
MGIHRIPGPHRLWIASAVAFGLAAIMAVFGGIGMAFAGVNAQSPVSLGNAKPFAVLAGTTVTNTGPSVISGDLGVYPGSAVTGFPPGQVKNGTQHAADTVARAAKAALTTAYTDAAGRTPFTKVPPALGGKTLAPGVYESATGLGLTGTVTLNAKGNANAVFIFQAGSTLITASHSTVSLINGAQACNVFWQVGSSATLGTNTTFVGNILALTSASLKTGATVNGRVLARNGEVSLEDNAITAAACSSGGGTTTTTSAGSTTTTAAGSGSTTTTSSPKVPGTHTGEPWAGWPYWALAGFFGLLGMVFLDRGIHTRRQT